MKINSIGIIGMGRFGKFTQKTLHNKFQKIKITTFNKGQSLNQIKNCTVIIPSVPISALSELYKNLAAMDLSSENIIIDVASVKEHPTNLMKKYLKQAQCIATHPLFGPDSAKNKLKGKMIMMHNVNAKKSTYNYVKKICKESLGLKILEMSPKMHDKYIAKSQLYTHIIGRVGEKLNLKKTPLDTKGFTQLLKVQKYVVNDTKELFWDMLRYNKYSGQTLNQIKKAINDIEK